MINHVTPHKGRVFRAEFGVATDKLSPQRSALSPKVTGGSA